MVSVVLEMYMDVCPFNSYLFFLQTFIEHLLCTRHSNKKP